MILLFFLFICLFVYVCVWWIGHRMRGHRLTKNLTTLPGELPVIGHVHLYPGLIRLITKSSALTTASGGVVKFWRGPVVEFIVTDPNIALKLMNTCINKNPLYKFATSWVGQGLVTAEGAQWKQHRRLLNPAFSQHVLDGFLEVFNSQATRLTGSLQRRVGGGEFNHIPLLTKCSLETICRTALGLTDQQVDSIVNQEYGRAVARILEVYKVRFETSWMHINCLYRWSSMYKEEHEAVGVLKALTAHVLVKKKTAMGAGEAQGVSAASNRFKTFLDLLLDLGAEGALTDQEIADEVDTMIMAGYETSSSALLYVMLQLGKNTDVQDKVFKEIKEVFGESNRDVKKDDLSQLIYTEAVIKETLRMYPIAPILARVSDKEVKLGHFTVPANSSIYINIWGIHRHTMWGDPYAFRPERWLDPCTLPEDPSAFAAFSLGRRGCIGKAYAMMSMKTTLVHVLRSYKIFSKHKLVNTVNLFLKPLSGNLIEIQHR